MGGANWRLGGWRTLFTATHETQRGNSLEGAGEAWRCYRVPGQLALSFCHTNFEWISTGVDMLHGCEYVEGLSKVELQYIDNEIGFVGDHTSVGFVGDCMEN